MPTFTFETRLHVDDVQVHTLTETKSIKVDAIQQNTLIAKVDDTKDKDKKKDKLEPCRTRYRLDVSSAKVLALYTDAGHKGLKATIGDKTHKLDKPVILKQGTITKLKGPSVDLILENPGPTPVAVQVLVGSVGEMAMPKEAAKPAKNKAAFQKK